MNKFKVGEFVRLPGYEDRFNKQAYGIISKRIMTDLYIVEFNGGRSSFYSEDLEKLTELEKALFL